MQQSTDDMSVETGKSVQPSFNFTHQGHSPTEPPKNLLWGNDRCVTKESEDGRRLRAIEAKLDLVNQQVGELTQALRLSVQELRKVQCTSPQDALGHDYVESPGLLICRHCGKQHSVLSSNVRLY